MSQIIWLIRLIDWLIDWLLNSWKLKLRHGLSAIKYDATEAKAYDKTNCFNVSKNSWTVGKLHSDDGTLVVGAWKYNKDEESPHRINANKHPAMASILIIASFLKKIILIGWLFNGTLTQKGQFVPTAVEVNWLSRRAKDGQRDTMHITLNYTITM